MTQRDPLARTPRTRLGALPTLVLLLLALPACQSPVPDLQNTLRRDIDRHDYPAAYAFLRSKATEDAYRGRARAALLYDLERGSLALATGRDDEALDALADADLAGRYDVYGESATNTLRRWTLNDNAADWQQQPYTDLYVNVLRQLAWLRAGDPDRAVAESRQVLDNAEFLRDFYDRQLQAYESTHNLDAEQAYDLSRRFDPETQGVFVDTTLGTYLAALIFAHEGDTNRQRQAARQFADTAARFGNGFGVDARDFKDLAQLQPGDVNVVLVAFAGQSPRIVSAAASARGPLGVFAMPFPELRVRPSHVRHVRAELSTGRTADLPVVENLAEAAAENFRRTLPSVYARTLGRILFKATGAVAFDQLIVRQEIDDPGARFLIRYLMFLAILESEQPDLRTWTTLPGLAHAHALRLKPGNHRVRFHYDTPQGTYTSDWQPLTVTPTGLTAALGYYGR